MAQPMTRRTALGVLSASVALPALGQQAQAGIFHRRRGDAWVRGHMTGAEALVETLIAECVECIFGIPGAQQNELWDTLKTKRLRYTLVTHEYAATVMADGYARSTGKPGCICVVPGPGLTNALTGLGEALLDSIPMVCIVGDVSNARNAHAFQVHCLDQAALLRPVTKEVISVQNVSEIPDAVRRAFMIAQSGEPGPVGVVIPYNLLIQDARYNSGPLACAPVPFDEAAARRSWSLLGDRRCRVGIYAGLGCMDHSQALVQVAELLQAPVATSMSGKGAFPENHPLSVGWGYGPQGTRTAEHLFKQVDIVLAIGVKYSEVSTGFYSIPQHRQVVHVDINPNNLGRNIRTTECVNSDSGVYLQETLARGESLRRHTEPRLAECIRIAKCDEARTNAQTPDGCCVEPMAFLLALRRQTGPDTMAFIDVTVSQYWASETWTTPQPRTFFNPVDNQSMGWSIPAAMGAQKVHPGRQTITVTGDGCFLMSFPELITAGRELLPVKFFVLDDKAYHYMQELQKAAYNRTTATVLPRIDYRALAAGMGIGYQELRSNADLDGRIAAILRQDGPVLVRVETRYGERKVRWLEAARKRYTNELTTEQKLRFAARLGRRALDPTPDND